MRVRHPPLSHPVYASRDWCPNHESSVKSTYQLIPTEQIEFDRENPRIKVALEKYGDKLDEQRIRFALQTATEGSSTVSSYRSLKDSCKTLAGVSA